MKKTPRKNKKCHRKKETYAVNKFLRRRFRKEKKRLYKSKREKRKWWGHSIVAPKQFNLKDEQSHKELMCFIQDIFDSIKSSCDLRLDFKNTETMFVDAALVFMANLDKAIKLKDASSKIKIAPSSSRGINGVLTQIGVLDLCNQDFHINPEEEVGVVDWIGLSGNVSDKLIPKEIFNFLEKVVGHMPPRVLVSAVNEALLNIKHHAYADDALGTWWLLAHKKNDGVVIVVCDVGMGIPKSLESGSYEHHKLAQRYMIKLASKVQRNPKDSEMVRASMKIGKTRTGKGHRGKGLPAMMNVVEQLNDKQLVLNIYSNFGRFTKFGGVRKPVLNEYLDSIGGTVVVWMLPLCVDDMIAV